MQKKNNILRGIRIAVACVFLFGITLMLCDFTGLAHRYLGWMAKVQLLPAILSIGAGATILGLAITAVIIFVTLLFGRVYCSMICPMGIIQDTWSWWGGLKWQKKISRKMGKNRFSYRRENKVLRYSILGVFFVLMLFPATAWLSHLIAPYSAYARFVQSVVAPLYALCNNGLAAIAEHYGSYAFYTTEVWIKSGVTLAIALVTFAIIKAVAIAKGRLWCNTICPVGTMLGTLSRHALYRPVIDTNKCNGCGKCGKNCKAECIDTVHHTIDTSRCVDCFDCISQCNQGAISFCKAPRHEVVKEAPSATEAHNSNMQPAADGINRREFLGITGGLLATAAVANAQGKTDGGLAVIEQKKLPTRAVPVKPAGSVSLTHFATHCTACQLCVSACPEHVLRPSGNLMTLMQPEMQFDKGYCRPGCTRCSDVCPTGAISLKNMLTRAEEQIEPAAIKATVQMGHAVWIADNCVVLSDNVSCGNCARHCPAEAIYMVESDKSEHPIPVVDTEKCLGCGKCEYVCPSRPFSAIYVEGHEVQKRV